jgi:hypothetical protein
MLTSRSSNYQTNLATISYYITNIVSTGHILYNE